MSFDLDLFVIGGGSGGVRAARVAAEQGARVALAEESRMGGTCVIRGCVPKKLMVFASGHAQAMADAQAYGWQVTPGGFDWTAFRTRLSAELNRLEGIYTTNVGRPGVVIHKERARLVGENLVELASGKRLTAKHVLIATGARPVLPEVPGRELALISDQVFDLEALPKRLLIIGGGYIACEFAHVFAGFGSEVTLALRGDQVLRGFDGSARDLVMENLARSGIRVLSQHVVSQLSREGEAIRADFTTGDSTLADQVLYATGRRANTAGLGLAELGVQMTATGAIAVDATSATNLPWLSAVGDVTDRMQLTPVAIREAAAFVSTVIQGVPQAVDYTNVPSAIFTQPEYGAVGLSEEAARAQEEVEIYEARFNPMQSAFIGRDAKALFKLIISKASRKVLGCHIVAPGAGEMIQLAAVAVKMGATKEQFDAVVAVHPTMAEEIVLMRKPLR